MKKIIALVLALCLVLAVAVASAATITVENTKTHLSIENKDYKAYKIFDAVYGTGTNVAYKINKDSKFYTDADAKAVLGTYFDFTVTEGDPNNIVVTVKKDGEGNEITVDARALADALMDKIPSGAASTTATGGSDQKATFTGLDAGYYLITGIVAHKTTGQTVESAVCLISVKDSETINPKADIPDLDKKITAVKENDTAIPADLLDQDGKAAVAKVGSVVDYEITSKVPDLTGYSDYTYKFTDTMDAGLTYNRDMVLKIGTATIDLTTLGDGMYTPNDHGFVLQIPFSILTGKDGQDVSLVYSATVNDHALTYDYEKNSAHLTYSRTPDNDETNDTPDEHTYVIDINLDVDKVDGEGNKLSGAKFKLYKTVGEGDAATKSYYKWSNSKVTWTTEADADVFTTVTGGALDQQIRGLDQGTYYLVETEAPTGYNVLKDPVVVTITANEANDKVTYTATVGGVAATVNNGQVDLTAATQAEKQPVAVAGVLNQSGTQLPSTGGIGTTIFYILGGLLVIGAAVILVARRKAQD